MAFLAPALLGALLAIAIPILVHLVQRDRRRVVEFPSLMFLRKIPIQSMRRRAIRHWPLLVMRMLAFALLALAFSRPFVVGSAGLRAAGGDREVVILLDRSLSMGYGDHWARAQKEARAVVTGLGPGDRATLVLFDTDVEIGPRSARDRAALTAAIDGAAPGARATRIGAALRAAAGQLETSPLVRRDVVLISDFQASAWDRSQDVRLPAGVSLQPVPVSEPATHNTSVVGLTFERQPVQGGERVTATARVANRSADAATGRELALDVDGHRIDTARVSMGPDAVVTVTFAPFTVANAAARVTLRLEPDPLPADNLFFALLVPGGRVPVLVIESSNPSPEASLYVRRALGVAHDPAYDITVERVDRVAPAQIRSASAIVLNDTRPPAGAAGRELDAWIRAGGGLFVALGGGASWGDGDPDVLPGTLGAEVDRAGTRGATLGFVDYSHPVFEIFNTPRSGDLSAARVFRYRTLTSPPTVLARLDDGAVALAERRTGLGTVLAWTSSLDSYANDLALKPVFVPFILQSMKHLARYQPPRPWVTVGDVPPGLDARAGAPAGSGPADLVSEQGFHERRDGETTIVFAANSAPSESDLSRVDPQDLVAAVAAPGGGTQGAASRVLTNEEHERRQSVWWYLLAVGLVLLVVEGIVSSRLPRLA